MARLSGFPLAGSVAAATVVTAVACGLDVVGTVPADPTTPDSGRPITTDAATTNPSDAGGSADVGVGCPPAATFDNGELTVHRGGAPIVVDGDLSEWQCARFFTFDSSTAGMVVGEPNIPNSYSFAVAWDLLFVDVAVRVNDPPPLAGTDPTEIYKNDAVEIFLGFPSTDGQYGKTDHQWIVDWANRSRVFQGHGGAAPSTGFTSMVKTTPTGYEVEMRVAATELGRDTLEPNTKLGFDFAGDNSDGTTQASWMVWYRPSGAPACGSTACCNVYCDNRLLGGLTLAP